MSGEEPAAPRAEPPVRVRLLDTDDDTDRTTASLVSSLATRLIILHYTSGVGVVGALLAGLAAAGREASKTAEGARLRRALAAGPAGRNGQALWAALRIGDAAIGLPATPVLDHIRNDLALLVADDLADCLAGTPLPPSFRGGAGAAAGAPVAEVTFLDCLLGLWIQAREITRAIEAAGALAPPGVATAEIEPGPAGDDASGRLLR
jgi:hypothetical protein